MIILRLPEIVETGQERLFCAIRRGAHQFYMIPFDYLIPHI
jgi:hypothetical protein